MSSPLSPSSSSSSSSSDNKPHDTTTGKHKTYDAHAHAKKDEDVHKHQYGSSAATGDHHHGSDHHHHESHHHGSHQGGIDMHKDHDKDKHEKAAVTFEKKTEKDHDKDVHEKDKDWNKHHDTTTGKTGDYATHHQGSDADKDKVTKASITVEKKKEHDHDKDVHSSHDTNKDYNKDKDHENKGGFVNTIKDKVKEALVGHDKAHEKDLNDTNKHTAHNKDVGVGYSGAHDTTTHTGTHTATHAGTTGTHTDTHAGTTGTHVGTTGTHTGTTGTHTGIHTGTDHTDKHIGTTDHTSKHIGTTDHTDKHYTDDKHKHKDKDKDKHLFGIGGHTDKDKDKNKHSTHVGSTATSDTHSKKAKGTKTKKAKVPKPPTTDHVGLGAEHREVAYDQNSNVIACKNKDVIAPHTGTVGIDRNVNVIGGEQHVNQPHTAYPQTGVVGYDNTGVVSHDKNVTQAHNTTGVVGHDKNVNVVGDRATADRDVRIISHDRNANENVIGVADKNVAYPQTTTTTTYPQTGVVGHHDKDITHTHNTGVVGHHDKDTTHIHNTGVVGHDKNINQPYDTHNTGVVVGHDKNIGQSHNTGAVSHDKNANVMMTDQHKNIADPNAGVVGYHERHTDVLVAADKNAPPLADKNQATVDTHNTGVKTGTTSSTAATQPTTYKTVESK